MSGGLNSDGLKSGELMSSGLKSAHQFCHVSSSHALTGNIYYIKLQCPFVCLSVCLSVPPLFDTTVGPQPNLAHLFG